MQTFNSPWPDLNGKIILVTGGTGSFGQAFVRTVLKNYKVRKLIIFSRDEMKQFDMARSFTGPEASALRFFLGDVRDCDRLEAAMRGVDYVFHAAALKHVPAAEYNPFECIKTNVHGAENIVTAAIRVGVKKVVALSTDKAVNPINLYGASKLAADKIIIAANSLSGESGPRFAAVRYGNVIGSRGSIIPLFKSMIADGATHLPITDERMTRFWITLEQGVNFVLSSLAMMEGGEIFIPKIPSMRVVDVAKALAPNLPQKIVGIRPGEKLHEMMVTRDDARLTLELSDRYIIEPAFNYWSAGNHHAAYSKPVAEDFEYASNNNAEWLDGSGLISLLNSKN